MDILVPVILLTLLIAAWYATSKWYWDHYMEDPAKRF